MNTQAHGASRIQASKYDVPTTVALLKKELEGRGIPIFAEFDHQRNAQEVQLELRETRVLVFGSPAVGTLLMQENQSIAFELPLRIAVWQEKNGAVFLAVPDMDLLAAAYGLGHLPAVGKIRDLLEVLARIVSEPADLSGARPF